MVACYPAPPAIRDLWQTPPLGDWAVRDLNRPIPVAGGDGFAQPAKNTLEDNDNGISSPDSTSQGIGEPIDPSTGQDANYRAERGMQDQGAYRYLQFNKFLNHTLTHSLGRETLYNWADAQFNVGGVTYPRDYGFGPGYHGDATLEQGNVQIYMRPGIWRGAIPPGALRATPGMLYPNLSPGIGNQLNTPVGASSNGGRV